ncbi:MAG: hypothetical protein H5T74_04345 [Actinobacteria bacterium]|nr:hypothetical protein [Actinomycetota bacterium]
MAAGGAGRARGHSAYYVHYTAVFFLALILIVSAAAASCSSGSEKAAEKEEPVSQVENAQVLGRIMAHRNQLEGEIGEPVEAVISGDITALAEAGEETWALVRVADFRTTSVPQGTLKATPGSELSVRLRVTEGAPPLATGARAEINALVSKSKEGPVIIGRAYRIL